MKFILLVELPIHILQRLAHGPGFLAPFSSLSSALGTRLSLVTEHFPPPAVGSPTPGNGTARTS